MPTAKAGKIDVILTKSISRFARNTVDLLNTVRRLKELGVSVQFEKERIDSLTEDGELMLTLLASFAQEEIRSLSDNVKWGTGNDLKKVFPMVAFKSTGTAGRAIIWLSMRRRQRSFGSSTTIT